MLRISTSEQKNDHVEDVVKKSGHLQAKEQGLTLSQLGWTSPDGIIILDFWPPEMWEKYISVV